MQQREVVSRMLIRLKLFSKFPVKEILVLLVKLVVTLASIHIISRTVSLVNVGQLFVHMQIGWFGLAMAIFLLAQVVSALRCAYVVRTLGGELGFMESVRVHFIGFWFNQVLPTGFGGDVVKIALIKAQAGLGIAMRAVVVDRVSGLMILMLMLMIQLPLYLIYLEELHQALWIGLTASFFFFGVVALARLAHSLGGGGARWGLRHFIELLENLWLFSQRKPLWEQFWTSLVVHVNGIVTFGLIGHALGLVVDPLLFFLVVPLVSLVSLLPFSFAGWGLREASAIWLLPMIGIPHEGALGMAIGFGVLMLIAGLPGLLAYAMRRR